jgi:ribA/ribD-fused uncharacterized protein
MIKEFKGKYRVFSNFSLDPVSYRGVMYRTSEHAFQCAKTITQEDHDWILNQPTPGKAKRAGSKSGLDGRKVKIRLDWEEVRLDIMLEILRSKFQLPDLKKILLDTEDEILEEGNTWHDNFWGHCMCVGCYHIVAQNYLGKLLMQVREEYKNCRKFSKINE